MWGIIKRGGHCHFRLVIGDRRIILGGLMSFDWGGDGDRVVMVIIMRY